MRLNLISLGMESFTASNSSQWEVIKKTIALSDYYILILGNKYGTIDSKTGISYTEKEHKYALELGIPCLTFLSKDVPIAPEHIEGDEHRSKLKSFRKMASAGSMVDFCTNPDELMGKVSTAIIMEQIDSPRPGWVRNPQTSPEVAREMARLSSENAELRLSLESTRTDGDGNLLFNAIANQSLLGDLDFLSCFIDLGKLMVMRPRSNDDLKFYFTNSVVDKFGGPFHLQSLLNRFIGLCTSLDLVEADSILLPDYKFLTRYTLTALGKNLLKGIILSKYLKSDASVLNEESK